MRVIFDENFPVVVINNLRPLLRPDELTSFYELDGRGLCGTKDESLLGLLAGRGFDLIVTEDRNQWRDHRHEVVSCGMHWIAVKPAAKNAGLAGLSMSTAKILVAWHHIRDLIEETDGHVYAKVKGIEASRKQRLTVLTPPSRERGGGGGPDPRFVPGVHGAVAARSGVPGGAGVPDRAGFDEVMDAAGEESQDPDGRG